MTATESPQDFINRWKASGGAEMANSQLFLKELCDLLNLSPPNPTVADESANEYVFEKAVVFQDGDGNTSQGRIDLYKAGCFVLESKQGSEKQANEDAEALAKVTKRKKRRTGTATRNTPGWDQAMTRARQQARRYAQAVPGTQWPPFLIVCDVGYCFDLYADFTQSGKSYVPFPDPQNYRIGLDDLAEESTRELLRSIWTDPLSLDPSRRAAKVTRELAQRLAKLAKSLEQQPDNPPERVASFLMRCLFTMFAEDIGLLPEHGFTESLKKIRTTPEKFEPMVGDLWKVMNTGGFSNLLLEKLLQFNGGLFENSEALPLTTDQLELLIEAGEADWREVEPAIFGTLLERALDPVERHKLGAHYTPRAYVERLVMPTLIEPLREEYESAHAAATQLFEEGDSKNAILTIRQFHGKLCETTVLDPACGSGNFLYVALEHMKRLEGDVLNDLKAFGESQLPLLTIDPHQFLGIEVNPRASAITDLVLWIGYLQWHFRTRGKQSAPREPIIRNFHNIECRDAVLAWDSVEEVLDDAGNPVTRWDGRTMKTHPVTGEDVPDETARVTELKYINPRKAEWPKADYIVGNPPFIGAARMRDALGDGYSKTLRKTYNELPESIDYVMYWWHKAGEKVCCSEVAAFGLITTNSVRQAFNRRVIQNLLSSCNDFRLAYVVADHEWVDASDGADVRISMIVCDRKSQPGCLINNVDSSKRYRATGLAAESRGIILADLRVGVNLSDVKALKANANTSAPGVEPHGQAFVVGMEEAKVLGLDPITKVHPVIKPYRNGRDITSKPRNVFVLDAYGLDAQQLTVSHPEIYQWLLERVKPQRDQNPRKTRRENWWIFGEPSPQWRKISNDLPYYFATVKTSKHRTFVKLEGDILPDSKLIAIGLTDFYFLGVLSNRTHEQWALVTGARLGVGNDPTYVKSIGFEAFPFPDPSEELRQQIRDLGEQLDAHRKRQQELHPDLTMTGMYNVLEKLRSGETLTKKEQTIHEQGLVSVLKELHDRLDDAVADAYGWSRDLEEEEILQRLVDLNAERAAEEARGIVRYLRPEFQNPDGDAGQQTGLDIDVAEKAKPKIAAKIAKQPWPKSLPDRIAGVRNALAASAAPLSVDAVAKHFTRARKTDVAEILETLVSLGHIRQTDAGAFVS